MTPEEKLTAIRKLEQHVEEAEKIVERKKEQLKDAREFYEAKVLALREEINKDERQASIEFDGKVEVVGEPRQIGPSSSVIPLNQAK